MSWDFKVKSLVLLIAFSLIASCGNTKKISKKDKLNKDKTVSYNLEIAKFPKQSLIANDTNFIGYLDCSRLKKVLSFKRLIGLLVKNYYLNNVNDFYFTASDIYTSQEFLFFIKNFKFDTISNNGEKGEKEFVGNREIIKTVKTDNQQFAYVNFENDSIYGDYALVRELFYIYDKKVNAISDERYSFFENSSFLKDKKVFKLIFIPNQDYREILVKYLENQPILKPLFEDLNYFLLEIDIDDKDNFNLSFVINSKKESIDSIFNVINTQKKLLMTLNGSPYSNLNLNDFIKNINLLKNANLKKINDETLEISISFKEKDIEGYIK